MCKILGLTNMKKIKVSAKLINTIGKYMTPTDVDGFGYSIMDNHGDIWGEKFSDITLTNSRHLSKATCLPEDSSKFIAKTYDGWGKCKTDNNLFGMFHSRMATSEICIENTHPFYSDDNKTHLIHNGVVESNFKIKSTCDSEYILRAYEHGKMKSIEKYIDGWYACMFLLSDTKQMLVLKDDYCDLYVTYLTELESYMFCTSPDIINKLCRKLKWGRTYIDSVDHLKYMMFSPKQAKTEQEFKVGDFDKLDTTATVSTAKKCSFLGKFKKGETVTVSTDKEIDEYVAHYTLKD